MASPSDQGKVRAPEAARWVAAADLALNHVAGVLATGDAKQIALMKTGKGWLGLEKHFHVDDTNVDRVVQFVSKIFSDIAVTLASASTLFVDAAPSVGFFAQAKLGGNRFKNDPARGPVDGRIEFGPNYLKGKQFFQTAVIVHEAAHFADSTISHLASELPAPDGSPVDGPGHTGNTKKYSQLNSTEAMQNAYSYAQFALHMFIGFDKRLHFKSLAGGNFESE
jgi:hypothetical protein